MHQQEEQDTQPGDAVQEPRPVARLTSIHQFVSLRCAVAVDAQIGGRSGALKTGGGRGVYAGETSVGGAPSREGRLRYSVVTPGYRTSSSRSWRTTPLASIIRLALRPNKPRESRGRYD